MNETISFTVFGHAETAGSKRAFIVQQTICRECRYKVTDAEKLLANCPKCNARRPTPRAAVTDDNPQARSWKETIARSALLARMGEANLLTGALAVTMRFYRPRPQSHHGKSGLNGTGKASIAPTTRPDVLKLARCAEDALTGVVWSDDALIVEEHLFKFWDEPERLEIEIEQLTMTAKESEKAPKLFDAEPQKIASGF